MGRGRSCGRPIVSVGVAGAGPRLNGTGDALTYLAPALSTLMRWTTPA
jgi:hypothetical protein